MSHLLDNTKKMTNRKKIFLAQNCLKRIISQLKDDTKKLTKNQEKIRKIIFGSELSEAKNELTFRLHQKMTKNRENKIENDFWLGIV